MRKLLKKELVLTAAPITYFFLVFSFMTMIPGYPILVGVFFVCMGIFYSFQFAREYNDTLYTALLPVKKSDVVKAKFAFVILLELISTSISLILTLVRMTALSNSKVYEVNVLMNANLVYMFYVLLICATFNLIFMTGFFKTAYNVGKPFIVFSIAAFIIIGIAEILHHLPGFAFLNTTGFEQPGLQIGIFIAGVALYIIATVISVKVSKNRFERIDL